MKTNILIFVAVAALTWALTIVLDRQTPQIIEQPETSAERLQGTPAPDFSFTTPDGQERKLSDFKGKIVVLNFWASWCPPCVIEFPHLIKIASDNPEGLVVIALSSDMDAAGMLKFLRKHESLPPNMLAALDEDQKITHELFGTYKLPETILLDANQKMRRKIAGADWKPEDLVYFINELK